MQKKSLTETFNLTSKSTAQLPKAVTAVQKAELLTNRTGPVRVLIAEDSAVCRMALVSILQTDPGIRIVGTAHNGQEAIEMVERLRPDLVTMDINMPVMDGYEATRQIMNQAPCPIVMISSNYDSAHTFDALKAGALTVIKKPTSLDSPETFAAITSQIKLMADVKVLRHWSEDRMKQGMQTAVAPLAKPIEPFQPRGFKPRVIAIASSTGGPGALATILRPLPADFSVPILVVQHISEGFAEPFASWLDKQVSLSVRIGRESDEPKAGQVLIAPDNCHMSLSSRGTIILCKKSPGETICPSANYLFHSVAKTYGATAVGVVLTGMGDDGADGLKELYDAGAYTIAQNKETCVVFGMPAVAISRGVIKQVQPVDQISGTLTKLVCPSK